MDAPARSPLIRLHPADDVLVAREPIALGRMLPEFGLRARAQVPAGHKLAARRIAAGERVRKHDTVIGAATRDIEAGSTSTRTTSAWSRTSSTPPSAPTCGRWTT
mgnify:CR=1 FL=1